MLHFKTSSHSFNNSLSKVKNYKNHSNHWFFTFCMKNEVFCIFWSNGCSNHAQNLISSSLKQHGSIAESLKSLRCLVFELSCPLTCFLVFLFSCLPTESVFCDFLGNGLTNFDSVFGKRCAIPGTTLCIENLFGYFAYFFQKLRKTDFSIWPNTIYSHVVHGVNMI